MDYRLDYVDAHGEITQRKVRVYSLQATAVRGFCYLRCAIRTFRYDRIRAAVSLDTGAYLTFDEFMEEIAAYG